MKCRECSDTGTIEAPACRVRYGRRGADFVAVLPGHPELVHSQCFACDAPANRPVMRISHR